MKIVEIFNSIQGEGLWTGQPMTFIRLAGCPVNCPFCDTDYNKGTSMKLEEIVGKINNNHVCVTGGEPLVNPGITDLLERLLAVNPGDQIHVETSGCYLLPDIIEAYREYFWITVSPKGSWLGAERECIPSVIHDADEVKWLIPGTPIEFIEHFHNPDKHNFIQPVNNELTIHQGNLLRAYEVACDKQWPLSVQLHKLIDWR